MGSTPVPSPVRRVWSHPAGVLLAVQLLGIVVYPFMEDSAVGRGAFEAFGLVVLALVVRLVSASPGSTWIALPLAIGAAGLSIADAVASSRALDVSSGLLHAAVYFFAFGSLLRYMLADRQVTLDDLFAVGATFTLVGWAFAYLYGVVQTVWPGSFVAALEPGGARTWMELLFLSVTTLTNTGLSDVVPVRPHARAVVMLEQVVGLMYVALVISRMVGLTLHRRRLAPMDDATPPDGGDAPGT